MLFVPVCRRCHVEKALCVNRLWTACGSLAGVQGHTPYPVRLSICRKSFLAVLATGQRCFYVGKVSGFSCGALVLLFVSLRSVVFGYFTPFASVSPSFIKSSMPPVSACLLFCVFGGGVFTLLISLFLREALPTVALFLFV